MDALQIVTLVTAIVGAVTGSAALVWGVWQFVLAGPRIHAEILQGRYDARNLLSGGSAWSVSGPTVPAVVIRARNKGRAAVDVERVGVEMEDGTTFHQTSHSASSPTLPHRLEAQSSSDWVLDLHEVAAAVNAYTGVMSISRTTRAKIELATGKDVRSKNRLRIPAT